MTQKTPILLLLSLVFPFSLYAQMDNERIGADYIYIGDDNSGNGNNISFEKYDFRISFPKRMKKPGLTLFHKFNYAKTNIDYGNQPIVDSEIENFHSISYTIGLSKPILKGWFFTAFVSPNVSSNFESSINRNELRFFGMAIFSKPINQKKNLILSLGALYSRSIGIPAPIPIASLMWKPEPKWTMNFGFPRFDIQYQLSKSTIVKTNLFVAGENFTLTNDIYPYENDTKADNIDIMNIGAGIYLEQIITKRVKLNVNWGHTFHRNFDFKNGNDKVFSLDPDNNFFVNAGVSIKM